MMVKDRKGLKERPKGEGILWSRYILFFPLSYSVDHHPDLTNYMKIAKPFFSVKSSPEASVSR